jgi:hypothetical protein
MAALFGLDMGDVAEPAKVVAPPPDKQISPVREKNESGSKPVVPKVTPAKKVARAGTALPRKAAPRPVEWWKPAASKQVGKARLTADEKARSSGGRKVKPTS